MALWMKGIFLLLYSYSSALTTSVPHRLLRDEASHVVDESIFPSQDYGDRIKSGREAQGLHASSVVTGNDPSLALTYGEFPMHSTDELVDIALTHMQRQQQQQQEPLNFIDLGSGCGRLAIYFALSRGSRNQPWNIKGIEISNLLHGIASERVEMGSKLGHFDDCYSSSDDLSVDGCNTLELLEGAAETYKDTIGEAHIIFCYSTVWESSGFSEEVRAILLDHSWSLMLATSCRKGCIVITTDRALDPRNGWKLLERVEVDNHEVCGSIGYIQILS